MILHTIALHNFMSYADSKLDLTSVKIACLTGLNGAGKTALLDAVTWVLWEAARSSSDELVRLGQDEMWIDLCFQLDQNIYRVRRGRQRVGPRAGGRVMPRGTLEFQIWDGALEDWHPFNKSNGHDPAGAWRSLTAPSMRQTQQRICEMLKMDYDTFINSVYLRQGRADEFTTRPPAERKQVLAEILGLGYFDRLQELAKDEVRNRKAQIEFLEGALVLSSDLDEKIASANDEVSEVSERLTSVSSSLKEKQVCIADVRSEIDGLKFRQSHLEENKQRLEQIKTEISDLTAERERLTQSVSNNEQLLANAKQIETDAKEFHELKENVERLDGISLQLQEHLDRRSELRSSVAEMRGRLEVELDHLRQQCASLVEKRTSLQKAVKDQSKTQKSYQKYKELISEEAEMARKQEAFAQLSSRADQLHTHITELRLHLEATLEQREETLRDLIELQRSKESVDSEQAELRKQSELLDKLETEFDHVEEKGLKVKSEIEEIQQHKHELARRLTENKDKIVELRSSLVSSACPLCASPIVDRHAVIERYEKQNGGLQSEMGDLDTRLSELETKRADLRHQYVELKRQLDARKHLDIKIGEFNEKLAALSRADSMRAKLTAEIEEIKQRLAENNYAQVERESLINVKAEIHKLDFDAVIYSNLQSQLRMQRHAEARFHQLQRDLDDLSQLDKDLPELEKKLVALSTQLQSESFASDLQSEISQLDSIINEFKYDRNKHQSMRRELASRLPAAEREKELNLAREESPRLTRELTRVQTALETKSAEVKTLEESLNSLEERLKLLPALEERLKEELESLNSVQSEKDELETARAVAEAKITQLNSEKATLESKQTQLNESISELNDYSFLAEAFGKKGIQAVIIENAVPEIEAEANKILSRLSENQMHIALITQQATRQGNLVETLDIVIADEIGTRNYELFSGGEAFKINFAIRVALSRLLARRAGAKLETLIIDEGFGSQDETSRQRLIRAISSIKDDFARILVVTHIAEVKELFPVQIQVTKKEGVSQVQIVA